MLVHVPVYSNAPSCPTHPHVLLPHPHTHSHPFTPTHVHTQAPSSPPHPNTRANPFTPAHVHTSPPSCPMRIRRGGHAETARALAEAGAKLEARNKRGLTPLADAVATGGVDAATALLECGARVDARVRGWVTR
eukprot:289804-Chlamydomonas_euryale.AAC.1